MEKKHLRKSFITAGLMTLAIIVIAGFAGDYYFDLNDDVVMKDILSGAFTGTPAGHNIQMLYPVSAFISLFYRVFRGADWYGIFLCVCQYLCVFILFFRTHRIIRDVSLRVEALAMEFFLVLGVVGTHLLYIQYTYTCGFLSAIAAFLIITHKEEEKRDLITALLLIILAFLIRSEMLLLTLPMVGVAILMRWSLTRLDILKSREKDIPVSDYGKRKVLFMRYVRFCIMILAGLAVSQILHNIAYSPADWKEFNRLFDARTELYDFQYIPDYEAHRDFYESIGLSESEQQLLINYNFGLDEEINADTLDAVAKYAAGLRTDEIPLPTQLINAVPSYIYRLYHVAPQKSYEYPMSDYPWNIIAGVMYLGVLLVYLFTKEKGKKLPVVLLLATLFACRSVLWLYIIVRGRDPIRITHPMYLVEILILFGLLCYRGRDHRRNLFIPIVISAIVAVLSVPNQYEICVQEAEQRALMRSHYDALYDYFDANRDNFYFVDVYTSVSVADAIDYSEATFSEKMFDRVDNREANHDLMGGWASKSPLTAQKYELHGFASMQDALLLDNTYFVQLTTDDIRWITDYYSEKGIAVKADKVDEIADVFAVYSLNLE
ncbi:MAG: hypothetical protein K6G10_03675 [Butyrivibrio sp.]|nr:hypothetical protein [Butyrivibrio sp.]